MMKWRPWPPIFTKKFQVNLTLHCLEGLPSMTGKSGELGSPSAATKSGEHDRVTVNVKWKGSKGVLGSRFRSHKRAKTTERVLEDNCIVNWEEEFEHVCTLIMAKDNAFLPWEIHLEILQVGTKSKLSVIGSAIMNLADFASPTENAKQTTKIPVLSLGAAENQAALVVSVNFLELRTNDNLILDRFMAPSLPCLSGQLLWSKSDQQLQEETSEKKLNVKRPFSVNGKKNSGELDALSDGKLSPRSDQSSGDAGDPFTSDSVDDSEEEEIVDGEDCHFQSYGSLTGVNLVVEGALPFGKGNRQRAERTLSLGSIASIETVSKAADDSCTSDSDQSVTQPSMRSLLSWRKRKLSFRSRQAKGEPLLNKSYGEDGGDDIDYFRRLSGLPIDPLPALSPKGEDGTPYLALDFGDEHFSVGSWEKKDLVSRDGQMRLSANVFFASIDQRSERAAGESACTALVAVIADWLHQNPDRMPIKAEFDTLIREGSAEWRKLCEIEAYRDRFPDGHFDLDTVLQANVRSLIVAPEKSFIGFFQPEGVGDSCSFLQGAMSFDSIWEAIWEEKPDGSFNPAVYIVSWNDHFFILKVEKEAYYIIDTLGERLYEGCHQAYILCFDKETSLCHVPKSEEVAEQDSCGPSSSSSETPSSTSLAAPTSSPSSPQLNPAQQSAPQADPNNQANEAELTALDHLNAESSIAYTGKDACKQFLKGFFAALPLRELQIDIKKGLMGKVPLHQRLQIEFHFTSLTIGQSIIGI